MRSKRILLCNEGNKDSSGTAAKRDMVIKNNEKTYQPPKTAASGLVQSIFNNPNLAFQILVIAITIASDKGKMDRGLDSMTGMIDKLRKIADVLDTTMGSVRTAAETPQKIRQLLK